MANRIIVTVGKINYDEGQIRVMLSGPSGEVSEDIRRRARAVQRRAQTAAPYATGALRSSIHVNTTYPSAGASADITAEAPHALYVEFGRRAVTPTNKRWLHWSGPAGPVFTKYAQSVAGVHFMRDALDVADD